MPDGKAPELQQSKVQGWILSFPDVSQDGWPVRSRHMHMDTTRSNNLRSIRSFTFRLPTLRQLEAQIRERGRQFSMRYGAAVISLPYAFVLNVGGLDKS